MINSQDSLPIMTSVPHCAANLFFLDESVIRLVECSDWFEFQSSRSLYAPDRLPCIMLSGHHPINIASVVFAIAFFVAAIIPDIDNKPLLMASLSDKRGLSVNKQNNLRRWKFHRHREHGPLCRSPHKKLQTPRKQANYDCIQVFAIKIT